MFCLPSSLTFEFGLVLCCCTDGVDVATFLRRYSVFSISMIDSFAKCCALNIWRLIIRYYFNNLSRHWWLSEVWIVCKKVMAFKNVNFGFNVSIDVISDRHLQWISIKTLQFFLICYTCLKFDSNINGKFMIL